MKVGCRGKHTFVFGFSWPDYEEKFGLSDCTLVTGQQYNIPRQMEHFEVLIKMNILM